MNLHTIQLPTRSARSVTVLITFTWNASKSGLPVAIFWTNRSTQISVKFAWPSTKSTFGWSRFFVRKLFPKTSERTQKDFAVNWFLLWCFFLSWYWEFMYWGVWYLRENRKVDRSELCCRCLTEHALRSQYFWYSFFCWFLGYFFTPGSDSFGWTLSSRSRLWKGRKNRWTDWKRCSAESDDSKK